MAREELALKEASIKEIFNGYEKCVYEIPIYQRNYAWGKDEISALVQDIYDAYSKKSNKPYYIGTLVSFHKGDNVFEIIDGQQRLTTLRILLDVLGLEVQNKLTYRARRKSDNTLKNLGKKFSNDEELDEGIISGYKYAESAIKNLGFQEGGKEKKEFVAFFEDKVRIIHYQVPKDIDLNHYFEIMNSRGEQLEKHEIVKAKLMSKLADDEKKAFNIIWESCAEMNIYVQQSFVKNNKEDIFGEKHDRFIVESFEQIVKSIGAAEDKEYQKISLKDIINKWGEEGEAKEKKQIETKDSFIPIIDFPNFLLIVLKISQMNEQGFDANGFILDDKELINEFDKAKMDSDKIKKFAYNLLKARFFLDNYVVHHSKEEDSPDNNPWSIQTRDKEGNLKNTVGTSQDELVHLLSMFEVAFTARQRKNYLFYCLFYLLNDYDGNTVDYLAFVKELADRYFIGVYMDEDKLNANHRPKPGSFDEVMLAKNSLNRTKLTEKTKAAFIDMYGDGTEATKGIPLFVFNYIDYRLWKLYDTDAKNLDKESPKRKAFFSTLGCEDFGLKVFDRFYFSRTRTSLEHYYPQANVIADEGGLNEAQINCLGNFAMIGSEANSSGSNWSPKAKLDHYLDKSKKINPVSVASLKFRIMMQICKDKGRWEFEEIKEHQEKMLRIIFEK